MKKQHSHYFKDVSTLNHIDVYRIIELYEITCPVAQHILKKAIAAGKRGAKDQAKDMVEIADSANRWLEMRAEDVIDSVQFDEARVDRVASSHGDGEHYADLDAARVVSE
jgi:hypothetical protein